MRLNLSSERPINKQAVFRFYLLQIEAETTFYSISKVTKYQKKLIGRLNLVAFVSVSISNFAKVFTNPGPLTLCKK